ncbi:Phosphoribosyl 1,2-cyclic phosphodiesterase [Rhizobiales bacterium GAS191]|nr:Phosphoribosyl 1,2-cyclic phosphodiesterase [Rhizobiales bacterium GAS191]
MGKMDARMPGRLDIPPIAASGLAVRFFGVRGTIPVPGPGTLIYGGNTACVEVRVNGRLFIIDAGSGIIGLGDVLAGTPERSFDILLSHLHQDHIIGLPFFAPLWDPSRHIRVHAGNLGGETPEAALRKLFGPPLFPIELDHQARNNVDFVGFKAGETLSFEDGSTVRTTPLRHPGGATGYRFDYGGRALAYISDFEHAGPTPEPDIVDFVGGCDLVIYDTTFTVEDYPPCKGWGHSTIEAGLALCAAAGAGRLAAFHHNPYYDDVKLAHMEAALQKALPGSFCAREGQVVHLAEIAVPAGQRSAG